MRVRFHGALLVAICLVILAGCSGSEEASGQHELRWVLHDKSVMVARFETWPVPSGEPVRLQVVTTKGALGMKNVGIVQFAFTATGNLEREGYLAMGSAGKGVNEDLWESTVTVDERAPYLHFALNLLSTGELEELDPKLVELK